TNLITLDHHPAQARRQPNTTERLTYNNAVPAEPDRHNCTVSIENVENVVNELSKLVPSIRRNLVHIFPRLESAVNSQPSNTHPAVLTANVPYGNPSPAGIASTMATVPSIPNNRSHHP